MELFDLTSSEPPIARAMLAFHYGLACHDLGCFRLWRSSAPKWWRRALRPLA